MHHHITNDHSEDRIIFHWIFAYTSFCCYGFSCILLHLWWTENMKLLNSVTLINIELIILVQMLAALEFHKWIHSIILSCFQFERRYSKSCLFWNAKRTHTYTCMDTHAHTRTHGIFYSRSLVFNFILVFLILQTCNVCKLFEIKLKLNWSIVFKSSEVVEWCELVLCLSFRFALTWAKVDWESDGCDARQSSGEFGP